MAVKDDNIYHPTEGLILSQPRRHYSTSVSPVHWQLRSLIGAEKNHIVYFPAGTANLHVQRLNTRTRETETIKLLPFHPRCLVARNGWVCCGGEQGEFTAIQVEGGRDMSDLDQPRPGLDPDERLPLDLDASRSEDRVASILSRLPRHKSLIAKSKSFGKERVNCITMWFPPTLVRQSQGAYGQAVAVLANNDKTVVLVSLQEQEVMDEIPYPDCVNRAVISPDGRMLAAICDDPYLYIHERVEKHIGRSRPFRSTDRPVYEWKPCHKIHLKSQNKDDKSDNRGSFAVCFSTSGTYLAVGTQYGTISVFNVAAFSEPDCDPLITSFTSSRPNSELGAIREMSFAPGPIDLLAWTEDRGRVGIADVRSGFASIQTVNLDGQDTYEHINITEKNTSERRSIDPRLLEQRNERGDSLSSSFANTLDLSLEGRQNRRSEGRESLGWDQYHYPLTPDETLVLEALQEHRRRREQRTTQSNSSTRLPWAERNTRSPLATEASRLRERSTSVSRAVSDILGNIRDQRERLREAEQRLRATREDIDSDARRSGVPPPPRRAGTLASAASATENDRAGTRPTLVQRLVANGLSNTPPPAPSGGWADLEALYNLSFEGASYENARAALDTTTTTNNNTSAYSDTRRRERAAYLMREWDGQSYRRTTGTHLARDNRPDPYDTAGLTWSENGQILFIGTEGGIYEFHVNLFSRKLFPSVTLR